MSTIPHEAVAALLEINDVRQVQELREFLICEYREWKSSDRPVGANAWAHLLANDVCIDPRDREDWKAAITEAEWPSWRTVEGQKIIEFAAQLKSKQGRRSQW
jgi:hypothetical protein